MDSDKVKEILGELKIYIEIGAVAFAGLQAVVKLLEKGKDLSQAELDAILAENRAKIEENKKKLENL